MGSTMLEIETQGMAIQRREKYENQAGQGTHELTLEAGRISAARSGNKRSSSGGVMVSRALMGGKKQVTPAYQTEESGSQC